MTIISKELCVSVSLTPYDEIRLIVWRIIPQNHLLFFISKCFSQNPAALLLLGDKRSDLNTDHSCLLSVSVYTRRSQPHK